ncbi:hypothetical protein M9Y10_025751 [Tritrichomonas musculus]|uniref:Protein kinase domain-containing protein n=1 Tax=Tritrichomonas musculus TaxID=1915356 RepID=A0ABR2HBY0_9EUKA
MDDLIEFELPEKDPPSIDSLELLVNNQEDEKDKKEKANKEKNFDLNTNLIHLKNEDNETNNIKLENAPLPTEHISQKQSLSSSSQSSSPQTTEHETKNILDEVDNDSLIQIPSPASVLREHISTASSRSNITAEDNYQQQDKLQKISQPQLQQLQQFSQQISQQQSFSNSSQSSIPQSKEHENDIEESDSLIQIPLPATVLRENISTPIPIENKPQQAGQFQQQQLQQQQLQSQSQQQIQQQQKLLQIPQQPEQQPRQQFEQQPQQQFEQQPQQQSEQQPQQQFEQQPQQQSEQQSQQQSEQQSQQQFEQQPQQQSEQQPQQQSEQQPQLQQIQHQNQQQSQPQPQQQQQLQSQISQPQIDVPKKHVKIQPPSIPIANQPNTQLSAEANSDSKSLIILVNEKNANEANKKNNTGVTESNVHRNGNADINISINLDEPITLNAEENKDNNDFLIDFTEIPISNNPKKTSIDNDILELQPTPQWVNVIHSYITNLISLQLSIAIHRSKLFSLYDCFRDLQKNFKPDLTLEIPTLKATCCNLIDCINKARQIVYSCSASHWGQSAITWPASTIKDSVRRLREDINECIVQFNCRKPAPNFLISDKELEAQDKVDQLQLKGSLLEYLNRISEQGQKTPQMEQIVQLIKQRLDSIGPVEGIQEGPALLHITPFLPSRLNLVLDKKDFVVCQKIGCGTFGSVYKGYMAKSQKPVAIKMLNAHLLGGRQLETFKREVWTMANLNHPSILHLVGITLTAPFCIVTELLKCSLYDRLKFLSPTKRSVIALRVSQAMEQLHAARIIHRDLKSANILLDDDDMPRVCDFGLVGFKKRGTKTGFVGTAQWMAPEILRSSPFYDEKVDVYSFAVLLWEMLTQKQPYMNMTQDQMVLAIIEKGLRPEIGNGPEFGPPGLISLIKKCWSEKPSDRPSFPQISTALFLPECHFIGTDEEEFKRLSTKQLLSSMIIHAYDTCNWQRLDELLDSVTPEQSNEDPELINTIIALFPNLNDDRKLKILECLPKILDLEQFLRLKGYSFIVSLFSSEKPSNSPKVIQMSVKMLRTIPLSSKGFRQVKLISSLSKCLNDDALLFLADLCNYEDIAKQVADHYIPFNVKIGQEIILLKIYRNILKFPKLRQKVAECLQPVHLAAVTIHDYPNEVCECLVNYGFVMDHSKLIINIDLIPKIAEVASQTPLALKLLSKIFFICSVEDLAEYKEIIHELLQNYGQFFKDQNIYLKLASIDQNQNTSQLNSNSGSLSASNSMSANISRSNSRAASAAISRSPSNVPTHKVFNVHATVQSAAVSRSPSVVSTTPNIQYPQSTVQSASISRSSSNVNTANASNNISSAADSNTSNHFSSSASRSNSIPQVDVNNQEHLIDPHPIEEHLIDPHPVEEHLIDPHPLEEHLIDTHPIEQQLIDPHPVDHHIADQHSQQKLIRFIDPASENPQFNTQPQYAQQFSLIELNKPQDQTSDQK